MRDFLKALRLSCFLKDKWWKRIQISTIGEDPFVYIGDISVTFLDYPDNSSLSILVYFIGCPHNCVGCHSPRFKEVSDTFLKIKLSVFKKKIEEISKENKTKKIVFSGGDPLAYYNREFVRQALLCLPTYDICIYTGYDIGEVQKIGLQKFKFIKCGKYDERLTQKSEKTNEYIQFASSNQRLYNHKMRPVSKRGKYIFLKNK